MGSLGHRHGDTNPWEVAALSLAAPGSGHLALSILVTESPSLTPGIAEQEPRHPQLPAAPSPQPASVGQLLLMPAGHHGLSQPRAQAGELTNTHTSALPFAA